MDAKQKASETWGGKRNPGALNGKTKTKETTTTTSTTKRKNNKIDKTKKTKQKT